MDDDSLDFMEADYELPSFKLLDKERTLISPSDILEEAFEKISEWIQDETAKRWINHYSQIYNEGTQLHPGVSVAFALKRILTIIEDHESPEERLESIRMFEED